MTAPICVTLRETRMSTTNNKFLILCAIVNSFFLTVLLCLWADKFEVFFNKNLYIVELFKISILSLISYLFIKKILHTKYRNSKTIVTLTIISFVCINGFLYFKYSHLVYNNAIKNKLLRDTTIGKLSNKHSMANGSSANKLNFQEYELISTKHSLPIIDKQAKDINYEYSYDGFLPDFIINLEYKLPRDVRSKEVNYQHKDYSLQVNVEKMNNYQLIKHLESER